MAAKSLFFYLLAAMQAAVFFGFVRALRWAAGVEQLHGGLWPLVYLLPAAWAATGLGLLLSAWVGRNRLAAGFVLPLLMMVQIVFSVHVAGNGKRLLHNAYSVSQPAGESLVLAPSLFTISRWGDVALRSFAYGTGGWCTMPSVALGATRVPPSCTITDDKENMPGPCS